MRKQDPVVACGDQCPNRHPLYDPNNQHIPTLEDDGTKIYTPFPEYEEMVPTSGATTKRSSYFLAGQLIAVRVVTGSSSTLYFTFADHLGNVSAVTYSGGTLVAGSLARYEPFGGFRTEPTSNPAITDRGFTGHKSNNTGTYDLGLIYMNARYYLPEIGRFISADTIVPTPQNPQSFNRYSYTLNNPVRYTDPTGHRETDGCETGGCHLTEADRRNAITVYANLLLKDARDTMTDVDILAEVMDFAAGFNTSMMEWADDLTSVINNTTGPFTLITALPAAFLGYPKPEFGDAGFAEIYQDQQNQVYHWWAYVNTGAQGGFYLTNSLGRLANDVHEFVDFVEPLSGNRGASWQDYALSENGMMFGVALYSGALSPDNASDAMRVMLETDTRRPVVRWMANNVSNNWLLPNLFAEVLDWFR